MYSLPHKDKFPTLYLGIFSFLVVAMLFAWQGNKEFSLWDEGYLWYGAQRVMLGEVPIRDFMAYDPGRYYWAAAIMSVLGSNGIMALRGAIAVFQAMGLFVGLWLIARQAKGRDLPYLLLATITFVMWMYPRHKLFDISLSIFLIYILSFLIENPTGRRYFLTGVVVGSVAVFGRNHGVYGALGSIISIVWLNRGRKAGPGLCKGLLLWASGVALGFMPILLMALLMPGFASAFWESIRFIFEIKATNLPLPVPWPWHTHMASASMGEAIRHVLIGLFFMAILAFSALSICWMFWQGKYQEKPVPAEMAAASFLSLPYAQYAFSRADVNHLAQGIFPFLIGCLVFASLRSPKVKWPFAASLAAASLWVMFVLQPEWLCRNGQQCVHVEISGNNLEVSRETASDITLLRRLANEYASNGQSFITAPFWPGAYALLDRKAPMWEIYPIFPRPPSFQQAELKRIKASRPAFAVILNWPLDGHDSLRFQNTHPLIYQYIHSNFERIPDPAYPSYEIFKSR